MKKLTNWLRKLDDNLAHIALGFFLVASVLLPKIPVLHVEYTYIRVRWDDVLPLILSAVFLIQLLRRKIQLNTKFLPHILVFWASVFVSFLIGTYLQNTIAVENIGLLHSLRRIQYMIVFIISSSIVTTREQFYSYMKLYFFTLFGVELYGLGQRFLGFPSIQSMNPAYVDGRILVLNPEDRINSTFGGHFDLAAYLTFTIPILLGFFYFKKESRWWYFATYVLGLVILLYTSARSSFGAYLISITLYLLYIRKFKMLLAVILVTALLLPLTGDMTKRILQTFQVKTVFYNQQTGGKDIDQKISVKNLPAGQKEINLPIVKNIITDSQAASMSAETKIKIKKVAIEQALAEARQSGRKINSAEIEERANEISKFIKPQKTLLCDISCSTRLEKEWPRAIGAFLYNPLFGTGPSSITEATDNDILRWLGELGIVGTSAFVFLLASIFIFLKRNMKTLKKEEQYIYLAFMFGLMALLINALYVDVFEASKVAYIFWFVAGIYVASFRQLKK